jgi:hypothetical protein
MRVNRLEIQVADVGAAVAWWRELLPDAETLRADERSAVVDVGGLELVLVRGEEPGSGRLGVHVAPERLDRLAEGRGVEVATEADGSRSFELEAPGGVAVRIFTEPDEETYAE